jgi:group I intron endonuclease
MNATENTECGVIGSTQTKNEPQAEKHIAVSGIYGLRNKLTNKWYIGQSINIYRRWNRYYKNPHCEQQVKLYNSLCKYGYENFDKIILEECVPDKTILDNREKYWISHYNSFNDGYNLTLGGGSGFITEEMKKKIGDANRGRKLGPMSKEHLEKRIKAQTGQKRSEEFRKRLSEVNLGKKHSDEAKKKMSIAKVGKKKPPFSEEWRKNISESAKNRSVPVSQETRDKMSIAAKNRPPPSAEARLKMSEASKKYWANKRLTAENKSLAG